MTAFIEEHRGTYGVEPMCKILQIAPSTYYERRAIARDPDLASARAKSDAALSVKIDAAWQDNRKLYGARKIWHVLRREGEDDLSVGTVGDAYDNALAECVIGLFKTEVINQIGPWKSMREVEWETLKWVDWYNNPRLLGPIGYIPPAEAEEAFYANINSLDMVA